MYHWWLKHLKTMKKWAVVGAVQEVALVAVVGLVLIVAAVHVLEAAMELAKVAAVEVARMDVQAVAVVYLTNLIY